MKILVTNDDGIQSEGLKILAQAAKSYGEVVVVAPFVEQSAKSQALLLKTPMEFAKVADICPGVSSYYLNGTPAGCVRVARFHLEYDFDIVLSGINKGFNMGEDNYYSGTMAAAMEGVLADKKGIAFSTNSKSFKTAKERISEILDLIINNKLLDIHPLYAVNITYDYKGLEFAYQGTARFKPIYEIKDNMITENGYLKQDISKIKGSDIYYIYQGISTIVPVKMERTEKEVLKKLKKLDINKDIKENNK